jgi:alpha-L-arabinofuranosidase
LFALTLGLCASVRAQTDISIYSDAPLSGGWQDWSWAGRDFASTANVHSGTTAIAVTASAWSALSLQHDAFDTTGYGKVTFWINGGAGGQTVLVKATLDHAGLDTNVVVGPLAANTWQQVSIPLASLAANGVANFTGVWFQEGTGTDQSANPFYIDDVVLTGSVPTIPPPPLNGAMAVYDDALVNGWQNWSWDTTVGTETTIVNSGASSMAVTLAGGGLSLHHDDIDTQSYQSLTFWINGGPVGGQLLALNIERDDGVRPALALSPLVANTWQKVTISLADIGAVNIPDLNRLTFREVSGGSTATFYLDDVRLDLAPPPSVVNVSIDGKKKVREVDARLFGLNTAIWDGVFNTVTTAILLNEADNQALRFPGGSASDEYHWQTNMSEGQTFQWATNFDAFANIAKATQAQVFITVNYGTGTPQEAADWVRYANKTKKLGFQYWEIGNENYGTWEADNNVRPNDPVTYATRVKEYARQMKAVDHSIQIGVVLVADEDSNANYTDETVTNPRTGVTHNGWTAVMLATFKQLKYTPDFVIYHRYEQGPGGENDAFLLNSSKTWGNNAASIRQMLNDYLGKDARKVEITCTENNSVYSNPGKQTTSLVNGLFMADSLGNIMKTEFNSFFWWDLRNGQEGGNNNSDSLYGWRKYGDYGIVNSADPAGPADRYPTFYVYKLLKNYARGGEKVVTASSDYNGLGAYAVRDHHTKTLNLLLINKHPTAALNVSVQVANFKVGQQAEVYTYGIPQDEAARTGTGSADVAHTTITLSGPTFTYTPDPYSATVIKISKPHGRNGHGGDDDDSDYFDCN